MPLPPNTGPSSRLVILLGFTALAAIAMYLTVNPGGTP